MFEIKTFTEEKDIDFLEDADPVRVSVVDQGANKRRFYLKNKSGENYKVVKIQHKKSIQISEDESVDYTEKFKNFLEKNFNNKNIEPEEIDGNMVVKSTDYDSSKNYEYIPLSDGFEIFIEKEEIFNLDKSQQKICDTVSIDSTEDKMLEDLKELFSKGAEILDKFEGSDSKKEVLKEEKAEDVSEKADEAKSEATEATTEDKGSAEKSEVEIALENSQKEIKDLKEKSDALAKDIQEIKKGNDELTKVLKQFNEIAKAIQDKNEKLEKSIETKSSELDKKFDSLNYGVSSNSEADTKEVEKKEEKSIPLKEDGGTFAAIFGRG